jgi:antirestriction protein ArdC
MAKGHLSNRWMTYRQASELGAQVRKGEHGSLVVYADRITKTERNDEGEAIEHEIPYMKGYTVFNVEQVEGLPESFYERPEVGAEKLELIETAEKFFAATGAIVRHGGHRAFYSPQLDLIQLPLPEAFRDAQSYAAAKAHELTHWTAHPSRLNRTLGKRFGDDAYAAEELIAELGAAFCCAALGITPEPREDHSAYIALAEGPQRRPPLLILIGLELMNTVKVYLEDHTVHVEAILAVALVALARKVIATNLSEYGSSVAGLALLIIALTASHWLFLRRSPAHKAEK